MHGQREQQHGCQADARGRQSGPQGGRARYTCAQQRAQQRSRRGRRWDRQSSTSRGRAQRSQRRAQLGQGAQRVCGVHSCTAISTSRAQHGSQVDHAAHRPCAQHQQHGVQCTRVSTGMRAAGSVVCGQQPLCSRAEHCIVAAKLAATAAAAKACSVVTPAVQLIHSMI